MSSLPTMDHVLSSTFSAYEIWERNGKHPFMGFKAEDITSKQSLFAQSRPYLYFRSIAIYLAGEKTDAPFEDVLKAFDINEAEYNANKTSVRTWYQTGHEQAIGIGKRITQAANMAPFVIKNPIVDQEAPVVKPSLVQKRKLPPVFAAEPFQKAAAPTPAAPIPSPIEKDEAFQKRNEALNTIFDLVRKHYTAVTRVDIPPTYMDRQENLKIIHFPRGIAIYIALKSLSKEDLSVDHLRLRMGERETGPIINAFNLTSMRIEMNDFTAHNVLNAVAKDMKLTPLQVETLKAGGWERPHAPSPQ